MPRSVKNRLVYWHWQKGYSGEVRTRLSGKWRERRDGQRDVQRDVMARQLRAEALHLLRSGARSAGLALQPLQLSSQISFRLSI